MKNLILAALLLSLLLLTLSCGKKTTEPQALPLPVFTPAGGTYTAEQMVAITCANADAIITFTTDGSDPVAASPQFTQPLLIAADTTLKARAFKDGWTQSPVATAVFNFAQIAREMIFVQGGTFNPTATYTVTLSDFYLSKYELTQGEFQAVMGYNPSQFGGLINHPVDRVSWFDAIAFCNKLSLQRQYTPCYSYPNYGTDPDAWPQGWDEIDANQDCVSCNWSANGYRLPTEMEWMFAAIGGNQSQGYTYSGGNDVEAVAWCNTNASAHTHSVGLRQPNELGFHDMSGNVMEWAWDGFYADYPTGEYLNPTGYLYAPQRVNRGGDWGDQIANCAVDWRSSLEPTFKWQYTGFRICRRDS